MANPTTSELDGDWESAQADAVAADHERAARAEADRPGVTIRGGETEFTSPLTTDVLDPETLLRRHGMDPEEWEILEVKAGQWQASAKNKLTQAFIHTDLHQIRVRVRPKKVPLWIVPASGASPVCRPKPITPAKGKTRLTLVTTDLQVPFHDPKLHELSLRLAEIIKPDAWADLGDVLDLEMLGRHRRKPEFKTTFQESVNVGGRVFAERRQAVGPDCLCDVLWGNHDTRLRNWLIDHAPELFGVTRAQLGFADDQQSVMDLDFLLRLDASGWRKARSPYGEWPYECIWITPDLAGIHGSHVRKGSGNSVRQEILARDHSVMQGHVNNLSAITLTRAGRSGKAFTVWGIEAGLMCLTEGSLGFGGQTSDWTRGLLTITAFPNGRIVPDLGHYHDGELLYRGMSLKYTAKGVRVEM